MFIVLCKFWANEPFLYLYIAYSDVLNLSMIVPNLVDVEVKVRTVRFLLVFVKKQASKMLVSFTRKFLRPMTDKTLQPSMFKQA